MPEEKKNDQTQMKMFKMKLYVVPSFLYTGWPDSTSFYDSETAQPENEKKKMALTVTSFDTHDWAEEALDNNGHQTDD